MSLKLENNIPIKAISWMSFFWSTASLMVFAILPIFITEELAASHTKLGFIEGIALACSFLTKIWAGTMSDIYNKRKPFILFGSIFSTISKPLFAFASSYSFIFFARLIDRFSKGLRAAPTDAFIADYGLKNEYGKIFGYRQSLYTLGAVTGSFISMIIMYLSNNNYRLVFSLAIIPNICALLLFMTHLNPSTTQMKVSVQSKQSQSHFNLHKIKQLPKKYWKLLFVVCFLMMARFSEAFLTLHSQNLGCPITLLPLVIIIMDLVHTFMAKPFGELADKYPRNQILLFALLFLIFTNFVLYYANNLPLLFFGIICVGAHMGMSQGLLKSIIADYTPPSLRGTSFALFYLVSGVFVLISNIFTGFISDYFELKFVFLSGAFFTLLSSVALFSIIYTSSKESSFTKKILSNS